MMRAKGCALPAAALSLALSIAGACASPSEIYHWGNYEECVLDQCHDPGGARAAELIRNLSADIEKARVEGLVVGPGLHAELGYLYYVTGNYESAALEFAAEKELYPESAVFMGGILERMTGKKRT
jgi:hypothetical protein